MKSNSIGQLSLVVTAVSLVGFTTSLPATAATLYNVLDLGVARDSATATGINDLGQVIGLIESNRQSFRTAPNSPINPATDIVASLNNVGESTPNDINNSGQVVGTGIPFSRFTTGFITQPNGSTGVDNIFIGSANAINDLGQVAGRDLVTDPATSASIYHAALANPGSGTGRIDLGTLGGRDSSGNGLNNLGQVVGSSETADGQTRAFRTAANTAINSATDDLGTLGGSFSSATDINDIGQVIGNSTTESGETHAFRTAANTAINPETDDLGTLGGSSSFANSINGLGQVVGDSELANGEDRGFLFDEAKMFDLNDLIAGDANLLITSAVGINNKGQIAANAFFLDSQASRPVLLTPVPEPTTMLGVLAFGAGAGILRKRAAKQKVKA